MKSRSLYVALALTIAAAAAMVFTPAPAAAGDPVHSAAGML